MGQGSHIIYNGVT